MVAHVYPRRIVSTATTVTVTGASTALLTAAAATSSNTFNSFNGGGLTTRSAHPVLGVQVHVLEDGFSSNNYQTLGYSGKGTYDTTTKQVLFMGNGAGSNNNNLDYRKNTLARYNEASDSWSALRSFLETGNSTGYPSMVHQYDSNALDIAGRKLYKKYGSQNFWMAWNVDTGVFNYVPGPSGHSSAFWWDGGDIVPTRGAAGAMWVLGFGSGGLILWEYDIATAAWSVLKTSANLGNPSFDGSNANAPVVSYNPRAFSGAGGVMMGYTGDTWTINCSTLAMTLVSDPPTGSIAIAYNGSHNSGFCRDPVGVGYLMFSNQNTIVYRWDGSSWGTRAAMPSHFSGGVRNFNVTPIDTHGVVLVLSADAGPAGWLYRP